MEELKELNKNYTPGAVRRIAYCVKSCAVLAVLLCAAQVFLGCEYELAQKNNEGESQGEKLYTVSGRVGGSGAQNSARNAQAALPTADRYTVTITPLDESGAPDASKAETIDVDENGSFSIQLLEGKYTFTAEGFKDGKRVLSGAYSANPFVIPRDVLTPISITVTTISSSGGTGEVRLPLAFDENCGIKRVEARWKADGASKTRSFTAGNDGVTATADGVLTALTFTMKETDDAPLPTAGLYTVNFYFYGETQNGVEMELYSCTESISVSENLTTDTWQNESNKQYFTAGADGRLEFRLTKAVMNTLTMLYVDSGNGASSNSGSPFEPLDSIQTALERIELTNDGSTDYKIYLKTDITSTVDAPYGAETNSAFININPSQTLRLTIESFGGTRTINANRSATNTGRVMYIGENAEVTLNNINITGGYSDADGGGICNTGTLTMTGGKVSQCVSQTFGGGVCNFKGTLKLSGVTITGCSATEYGGGIYNYNGTLTVTGGSITNCTAATSGGGVFNNVTDASVVSRITNCTITTCTATADGGGIYNNVSDASAVTKIENCTISGCKALGTASGNGGGGIYNNAGTLSIDDGMVISGCSTNVSNGGRGGGVYNAADGVITMNGGTITGNTSYWSGGGVVNSGGTFTMNGGIISENTSTNNVGGGICNNDSGILTINNGTIYKNTARSGGGIYGGSKIVIKGGIISENVSANGGGGIHMQHNLVIEGGEIINNTATSVGGGIIMFGPFDMSGGTISGNKAGTLGGGLYSQAGMHTITDGVIKDNQAASGSCIYDSASVKLQGGTFSGDVVNNVNGYLCLSGDTTITDGCIDLTEFTDASKKEAVRIAGALSNSSVAKIKLGTAYAEGDTILQPSGYTLTAADCNRFTIDGGAYGIALSGGNGVLKKVPEGFVRVEGGTVVGKDNTDNYAGVFIAGRTVTLSPFYMCDHEVTQGEWKKALSSSQNTSGVTESPSYCTENSSSYAVPFGNVQENRPVEGVTWYDAVYYCNIRSEQEGLTKAYDISGITQSGGHITAATVSLVSDADGYRLPTEAEWEFAARGGDPNAEAWDYMFSGAATASGAHTSSGNAGMDTVGWYSWNNKDGTTGTASVTGDTSGKGTHEVKQKAANALDIYDMSGNVWEWCWDWYSMVASDTPATGPASGSSSSRILRGGAWISNANDCSVSNRNNVPPNCCNDNVGFRVVRSVSQ